SIGRTPSGRRAGRCGGDVDGDRSSRESFEAQVNQLPVPLVPLIGKGVQEDEVMVSFVATNGEPTTTATSKLVWWNLLEQMTMTSTSCTSATLSTRTRAPPLRALYKSGSIIVLGKTDFLRPDMVDPTSSVPRSTSKQ
ncbi:hypothetical protein ACJX0J_035047, partial [Zea mays]